MEASHTVSISENTVGESQARPQKYLITGGTGYVGSHLANELVSRGYNVVLYDIHSPATTTSNMSFIKGDVRNYEEVCNAFRGIDCVFHVASYGMSGKEQLNKRLIKQINVNGTKNVIKACQNNNVPTLVYTSTCNVVFCGEPIYDGDESLPYCASEKYLDHYSRTKAEAEKTVLAANGIQIKNGCKLNTVALRVAGIYGLGEQRHFPRVVGFLQSGFLLFQFGSREPKLDYIHIENFVDAHVKAAEALQIESSPNNRRNPAGQAYFISDGEPINTIDFFAPLTLGLGYSMPKIQLPFWWAVVFAMVCEYIHSLVGRFYNFEPVLTLLEVHKICIYHNFSIEKAKKDLGFEPKRVNDISEIVSYYQEAGYAVQNSSLPLRLTMKCVENIKNFIRAIPTLFIAILLVVVLPFL